MVSDGAVNPRDFTVCPQDCRSEPLTRASPEGISDGNNTYSKISMHELSIAGTLLDDIVKKSRGKKPVKVLIAVGAA